MNSWTSSTTEGRVILDQIDKRSPVVGPLEAFEEALTRTTVTKKINELLDLAIKETTMRGSVPAWFVNEQVEEEQTASDRGKTETDQGQFMDC